MSPRGRLIPPVLAAASAMILVLGGCSSSGDASAAPSTTAATTSASGTTSAPSSTDSGTSAAVGSGSGASSGAMTAGPSASAAQSPTDSPGDATSSVSAGGDKVPAEPTECASIAQKYGAVINAILPVLQGKTGSTPFDADQLDKAVKATTMGTIPAELDPEFAAFASAAEQLRGKDLTAAAGVLNGPAVSSATDHINKFLSDHC